MCFKISECFDTQCTCILLGDLAVLKSAFQGAKSGQLLRDLFCYSDKPGRCPAVLQGASHTATPSALAYSHIVCKQASKDHATRIAWRQLGSTARCAFSFLLVLFLSFPLAMRLDIAQLVRIRGRNAYAPDTITGEVQPITLRDPLSNPFTQLLALGVSA